MNFRKINFLFPTRDIPIPAETRNVHRQKRKNPYESDSGNLPATSVRSRPTGKPPRAILSSADTPDLPRTAPAKT